MSGKEEEIDGKTKQNHRSWDLYPDFVQKNEPDKVVSVFHSHSQKINVYICMNG